MKTDASNSSFPDDMVSRGLSRLIDLKRPSDDRKSGMPASTDIPAPVAENKQVIDDVRKEKRTTDNDDTLCLHDCLDNPSEMTVRVRRWDYKRRQRWGRG